MSVPPRSTLNGSSSSGRSKRSHDPPLTIRPGSTRTTWVPNALWLTEALTQHMTLVPGMNVLDLGCGTALSSIFLAREHGVRVWAADLWVPPAGNWERIVEAGVRHLVTPIHAEAHDLPFADQFFDAIVSIDSYHYFGTDERYLAYLLPFLKEGGQLGIVVPGNEADPEFVPDGLSDVFPATALSDFFTFRSALWWRRLWTRSGVVEVDVADMVPDGRSLWRRCMELDAAWEGGDMSEQMDTPLLDSEAGRTLGFALLVAHRLGSDTAPVGDEGPGARSVVQRMGEVIARPATAWSASVLSLLGHLEAVGFDGAPKRGGKLDTTRQVARFTSTWKATSSILMPGATRASTRWGGSCGGSTTRRPRLCRPRGLSGSNGSLGAAERTRSSATEILDLGISWPETGSPWH